MEDKKMLLDFLKSQRLISIALKGDELWIFTAYYYIDDKFNFYIFTSPNTRHGKLFKETNELVANVFDSHQKITDKKVGAQIRGRIVEVKQVEAIKRALDLWNNTNPGIADIINLANMRKRVISGRIFKITPQSIQFFNEALYKEKEFAEFTI